MNLTVEVLRETPGSPAYWESHAMVDLDPSMSILELLDRLNVRLVADGKEAVAFESDCREGVCGACGITVNGFPQGPTRNTPACHQRLRSFQDGQTIRLQPMNAHAYPVLKDLMIDRSALDALIEAGGYVSVDAGTAPDADAVPAPHDTVEEALDFAACIGCGACVAACPNGSAHLFLGAKLSHLSMLPLPSEERARRAKAMLEVADQNFGPCSNYGECALACPASIPLTAIGAVNKERLRATFKRQLFRRPRHSEAPRPEPER